MKKLVGLGEILWDVFPDGSVLGGAPGNFAMHVNSLGMEGYAVSTIGRDNLGSSVKDIFQERGLKSCLTEVDHPTGTVVVTLDEEGKATYDFTKNSAWDYITLSPDAKSLASECDAVCFGSLGQRSTISRDTIYRFLKLTKKSCIRIFDINIRENYYSRDIIEGSLEHANVLKLNDEELPLITEMLSLPENEDECLKLLKSRYSLDLVIVTKGADGSRLYRSETDDSFVVPGKTVVVDTVGAGDSFTAAVAVGLLSGDSLQDINVRANEVAAYVCGQKGGTPSLKDLI